MYDFILPQSQAVEKFASLVELRVNVIWALLGLLVALLAGSTVRLAAIRIMPSPDDANRLDSLRTWWTLTACLVAGTLGGRLGVVLLVATASVLAINEFTALSADRITDRRARVVAYVATLIHFFCLYQLWLAPALVVLPVGMLLSLAVVIVIKERTAGFLAEVGTLYWGVMLTVFCFSHTVFLWTLPGDMNPVGGAAGWFLFVVFLTEGNDIAQALVGRALGRHKIMPHVSPKKTWEGLIGGITCTALAACLLAPLLTPLAQGPPQSPVPWLWAVLAGILISVGGFFGDLTVSSIKRDLGVKDSSKALPGQGGILDRIDSLTFSAPLFFYFLKLLYG